MSFQMKLTESFSIFVAPPRNETFTERKERKARDREAQRINNLIEAQLEEDRIALESDKSAVRVLLLGQSGSGKSTAVKLFRMKYEWKEWEAQLTSWVPIIQLNVVNSIITIVDVLLAEQAVEVSNVSDIRSSSSLQTAALFSSDPEQLVLLRKQMCGVQVILQKRLGMKIDDKQNGVDSLLGSHVLEEASLDEPSNILSRCSAGMQSLWREDAVRNVLRKRKIKLDYNAEFFLDRISLVSQRFYKPSSNDVLHVWRRTLGVEECCIRMERGFPRYGDAFGKRWIFYDAGGPALLKMPNTSRLSFFDNVDVIIFYATISDFDERSPQDPGCSRLEESFQLWRVLCSSFLLKTKTIVLFLNKCDILKRKLDSGIKFRDSVPSFGEGSNDADSVVKYLQQKFREALKVHSPKPRPSYSYAGSLVESHNILVSATISAVEDSILRSHLEAASHV